MKRKRILRDYYVCPPWHSGDTFSIRATQVLALPLNTHVVGLGVFPSRARVELKHFIEFTGITPRTDLGWLPTDEAPAPDDSFLGRARALRRTVGQLVFDLRLAGLSCGSTALCGDHSIWSESSFPESISLDILGAPRGHFRLSIYADRYKVRRTFTGDFPLATEDLRWVQRHLSHKVQA